MTLGPNKEQQLAIEHTGGVLLRAGAGSGKTFVLVEHIIYLLKKFQSENQGKNESDLRLKLRGYLSSLVMMTFTRKASGEMSLRLNKRIKNEANSGDKFWRLVLDVLPSMTVTTIHGFCFKLLNQGLLQSVDPDLKILSDSEAKDRVTQLLDLWFEQNLFQEKESNLYEIFLSNRSSIESSLIHIFGNPSLRLMWNKFNVNELSTHNLENYFEEVFSILNISSIFESPVNLENYSSEKSKSWFKFLEKFQSLAKSNPLRGEKEYKLYLEFFDGVKRLTPPAKTTGLTDIIERFDEIKILRKFLRDHQDDFIAFFEAKEDSYLAWARTMKDIFDFIDDKYYFIPGFTFSDLEYYVLKGLETEGASERISQSYKYFIVDEFQDTSEVQFKIIEKIVDSNFSRLFCVGDMKQAIYGFRGGEVAVFKRCMEMMNKNLSMVNNYRSASQIVKFNNGLFSHIFPKGSSYKGRDEHSVIVEDQVSPENISEYGKIRRVKVDLSSDENFEKKGPSASDLNRIEAEILVQKIDQLRDEDPQSVICVLYSKLGPSKYLLPALMSKNIGFTSQVKIPINEDPVLGIFKVLSESFMEFREIQAKTDNNAQSEYSYILLNSYLNYLCVTIPRNLLELIKHFYKGLVTIGLEASFKKFVYELGVANSNYGNNQALLDSVFKLAKDDIDYAWKILEENSSFKYSVDFQYGDNPQKVLIMTAHSSKGLEFDEVLVGGIHTNGRRVVDHKLFGELPGSYRWKESSKQRKAYKSPVFILENFINVKKEFSESKRLFYVACTRAKKGLTWVDISYSGKAQYFSEDSWVNGLRLWDENEQTLKEILTDDQIVSKDLSHENSSVKEVPFFHKDPLGITSRGDNAFSCGLISELSVTRLTSLVDCPRKFYLLNICKFDESEMDILIENNNINEREYKKDEMDAKLKSSSGRGTFIHEVISQSLLRNWTLPMELNDKDRNSLEWILEELSSYREKYDFISEKLIKFSLFGHMISGTPDLVLRSKSSRESYIWDFKTGRHDETKELNYWFQLYSYAYALYILKNCSESESIDLILAYVDERKCLSKKVNYSDTVKFLTTYWMQLSNLDQTNQDHCESCQFNKLCH